MLGSYKKYLVYLIVLLIEIVIVTHFLIDYKKKERLHNENLLEFAEVSYNYTLKHFEEISKLIFEDDINRTDILENLYMAKFNRDSLDIYRENIYKELKCMSSFEKFGIGEIEFYLDDGVSFLRVYRPNLFGDNVTNLRYSALLSNSKQQYIRTFESCRIDSGFRFIHPLFFNNLHLGSFDIAISSAKIENFINSINSNREYFESQTVYSKFIFSKDNFELEVFKHDLKNTTKILNNYFVMDSSLDKFMSSLNKSENLNSKLQQNSQFVERVTVDDVCYSAIFYPIKDLKGEVIVYLNIFINDEFFINNRADLIKYLVGFSSLLIVVLALILLIDKKNRKLLYLLNNDSLTNLPNRFKLLNDVKDSKVKSLVLINIDNFKQINNFYGFSVGDELLKWIGQSLHNYANDIPEIIDIYKLPSDEFAILTNRSLNSAEIETFLDFKVVVGQPFIYESHEIYITLTVGIANLLFEDMANNLLLQANIALKKAKKERKPYLFFNDTMDTNKMYEKNLLWTKKLKFALEDNRVVPFFQPIVDKHNRANKFECLVRMIDDDKIISPYFFLDISKVTKQYPKITKQVFKKSFEYFRDSSCEFSINISIEDILDSDVTHFIKSYLEKDILVASRITFEILESEGIENYQDVSSFIKELKKFGCKIAIDDFGSGYSNFEHILRLDVDYLKIDGSLIKNIDKDANSKVIVESIVSFAKKLGIKTVAEFVHSEDVDRVVLELGIDYRQGYFLGEPSGALKKRKCGNGS